MILMQMAQYGQAGLPDEELEGIVCQSNVKSGGGTQDFRNN